MSSMIIDRVEQARAGNNPAVICQVKSGWVVLSDLQFLRGYCILLPDPVVTSINDLDQNHRTEFLSDMVLVGDALLEVTGSFRINYAIAGNTEPYLHAHIIPRYLSEPEALRKGFPFSYPDSVMNATLFSLERDRELISQLRQAIQKRY